MANSWQGKFPYRNDCADINLTIAYSEKSRAIELRADSAGPAGNPLDNGNAPDELGRTLIKAYTEEIAYTRDGERNQLHLRIK